MADTRPAVVGAFVLGGLALVVASILFFGGTHLFAPTVRAVVCVSAWNRDPTGGVIGVQKGPL